MNILQQFKEYFKDLGYIFQKNEVLEDIYTFYKYYDSKANKNVAAIVLEGDLGCGKTYLAEIFSKYCKGDYIQLYCCENTNKEQLIATLNFTAFLKGDAENVIAEGVLTKTIEQANSGNQVVLIIDELDKSQQTLDNYFLNHGEITTTDNKVLKLTPEAKKNVYVIFAKNNVRELNAMLIRRSSVIKLPPMPPALAFKILTRNYEDVPHDPNFLFVAFYMDLGKNVEYPLYDIINNIKIIFEQGTINDIAKKHKFKQMPESSVAITIFTNDLKKLV